MEIYLELLIFIYYLCVIFLTMILFSFIFNVISNRLFGKNPNKTKLYYFEIFCIWLVLACIIFFYKKNINDYNKKKFTEYIKTKNNYDENYSIDNLHNEIDNLEKFDIIVILGFVIMFIGSQHHTFNEKLSLFNEDINMVAEMFS